MRLPREQLPQYQDTGGRRARRPVCKPKIWRDPEAVGNVLTIFLDCCRKKKVFVEKHGYLSFWETLKTCSTQCVRTLLLCKETTSAKDQSPHVSDVFSLGPQMLFPTSNLLCPERGWPVLCIISAPIPSAFWLDSANGGTGKRQTGDRRKGGKGGRGRSEVLPCMIEAWL